MKHLFSNTRLLSLLALGTGLATAACGGSTSSAGVGSGGDDGGGGGHDGGGVANNDSGGGGDDEGGSSSEAGGGDDAGNVVVDAGVEGTAVQLYYCLGGVYTAGTTIGSQSFQLNIDTGSTTLGVASSTCSNCTGVTPLYAPGATATDEKQTATSQYGSGSWDGEIYLDSTAMPPETAFPLKFAAITKQTDFFQPQQTSCNSPDGNMQGILGMGPSGSAVTGTQGYFDGLLGANSGMPNVFTAELCDSGGSLWLGGYGDSSVMTAQPQYTPIINAFASFYYAVDLQSVEVNGVTTTIGTSTQSPSIVDTGTSTFLVSTTAYTAITNAIKSSSGATSALGASANTLFPTSGGGDTIACANVGKTKAQLDAALPPMTFNFAGGVVVQATATESYLFPLEGEWCSGITGVNPQELQGIASIFGSPMHRSSVIIYDRGNKRVGFAPHTTCK